MLALGALGAATGGFCSLSLAMDRHWEGLHGRGSAPSPLRRRQLRILGSVALLVALAACVALWGGAKGVVAWLGVLTAGALVSALSLTYAGRAVARLGWVAGTIALVSLAGALVA
ncbi:DUF3325 domain-containing protein [Massilia forsythiae]|uniref:DUF3325 domain-containing protein n=2 Tax=Massilia forsythiae TaxID=2728020 RepID=A0A7Z2W327_9BURK|nr:DUF3325 domain-containing protein [Massilia forsythiae]